MIRYMGKSKEHVKLQLSTSRIDNVCGDFTEDCSSAKTLTYLHGFFIRTGY